VADSSVDPYAWFLAVPTAKRYEEEISKRNLKSEWEPDRGHAFSLSRSTISGTRPTFDYLYSGRRLNHYDGVLINDAGNVVHNGTIFSGPTYTPQAAAFGQTGYGKVASRMVMFDAAQFLGELREGLPRLSSEALKGGLKTLKGAGSDYLNVQFGWLPLVKDIQNAVGALTKATQAFDSRGWNRRVHRSYGVRPITNAGSSEKLTTIPSVRALLSNGASLSTTLNGLYCDYHVDQTSSIQRWFEGEFTSFLPLGFDPNDYLSKAKLLINLELNPTVLWELTPWSWLVDWYLKIGDAIAGAQATANDRLIMHYGYSMEHAVFTTSVLTDNLRPRPGFEANVYPGLPSKIRHFRSDEFKTRVRANPYGFQAVSAGQLSASQVGILSALGLSQGVRVK